MESQKQAVLFILGERERIQMESKMCYYFPSFYLTERFSYMSKEKNICNTCMWTTAKDDPNVAQHLNRFHHTISHETYKLNSQ